MYATLITQLAITLMMGVCLAAALVGGRAEKLTALGAALNWALSGVVQDRSNAGPDWGIFALDVLFLAYMLPVTFRSGRLWMLAFTAFLLMTVLTHVARIIDPRIEQFGFFSAYYIWSWAGLAAFAFGVWQAARRPRP